LFTSEIKPGSLTFIEVDVGLAMVGNCVEKAIAQNYFCGRTEDFGSKRMRLGVYGLCLEEVVIVGRKEREELGLRPSVEFRLWSRSI
jgi:hypothetical protein